MGRLLLSLSVFVFINLSQSLPYLSDINNAFDKVEDKSVDTEDKVDRVDVVKRDVEAPFQLSAR